MTLYSVKSQSLLSDNQREKKLKVKACGSRPVLRRSSNVHVPLAGRLLLVEMVSFFGPGCFLAAKGGPMRVKLFKLRAFSRSAVGLPPTLSLPRDFLRKCPLFGETSARNDTNNFANLA